MNHSELFNEALQFHRAGHLREAEKLYLEILASRPLSPDPLHLAGVIAYQRGDCTQAIDLIRRAIKLNRRAADYHSNLGLALEKSGHLEQATDSYRTAVKLNPQQPQARNNLGNALKAIGASDEALVQYRKAISLRPDLAEAHNNIGLLLVKRKQLNAALEAFDQALKYQPDTANFHLNRGGVLLELHRPEEALVALRYAIGLQPLLAAAHSNLGLALKNLDQTDAATAHLQWAVSIDPTLAAAYYTLADHHRYCGRLEHAENCCVHALLLQPDSVDALSSLGTVLQELGLISAAVDKFEQAVLRAPDQPILHSNLIFTLQYCSGSELKISQELRRWNERHALPHAPSSPHLAYSRDLHRPLRIGYVSPDFRHHPVASFLLPILRAHDHSRFHITCFSCSHREDEVTRDIKALSDQWTNLAPLEDSDAARLIQEQKVDILVDLAGHSGGNRLPVFSRRPAPLQFSYLGFPGSTGLAQLDGRISDALADPASAQLADPADRVLCLPISAWCYSPLGALPAVADCPLQRNGFITFGSFNNHAKLSPEILNLWAKILRQLPTAKLLIKNKATPVSAISQGLRDFFRAQGVSSEQLQILEPTTAHSDHLSSYHRVDVALDSYPYHGTTTTCEALVMGVPVITLAGSVHRSRVGCSLLSNVGLPEFIARSEAEYVALAVSLAHDPSRLPSLRAGLRSKMQSSPLMDSARMARAVEGLFREEWVRWCARS